MPLPNSGGSNYVNNAEVLRQNNDNYSGRVDYVLSNRVNIFGRYSISNENDFVPDVVTARDQLSAMRPQKVAVGSVQTLDSTRVNEVRLGFNRLKFLTGLPEPFFQVGGQSMNLPRFLPSGYAAMEEPDRTPEQWAEAPFSRATIPTRPTIISPGKRAATR